MTLHSTAVRVSRTVSVILERAEHEWAGENDSDREYPVQSAGTTHMSTDIHVDTLTYLVEKSPLANGSSGTCLPLNSSKGFCLLQRCAPSVSQIDQRVQYFQ